LGAVADRVREQVEDHYRAELENLRLESQAEIERHRSLAQMVAGVAHELNTPLGITNTAIDMIASRLARAEIVAGFETSGRTKDLETICEATSLAQRNIARAHQLIQDFKKVSVDQFVDSPQWEDLAQLVAASVDLFQINARRANLTIEVDDRLPATSRSWFGYPGHLTQVVLNLLTNIETYAYEPGTGGRVEIVLSAADVPPVPTFTMTVRDYGRGIAAEHRERVFEPFFTTGRGEGGTGLGLSIVRNIVGGALKGEITLGATPGPGAMFRITFPQEVTSVQHQLAHLDR
jgi:signal transduction histidine kinase